MQPYAITVMRVINYLKLLNFFSLLFVDFISHCVRFFTIMIFVVTFYNTKKKLKRFCDIFLLKEI